MLQVLLYSLLIPPTCLLLPLALGLLWRRRWLAGLALAGLVVFAMPVTSARLNALIAVPPRAASAIPPQVVVILSAERRFGQPGGVIEGEDIGPNTTERVRAGIRLHRKTGLPILVTGGVLAPGATPIAAVMAQVMGAEYATPPRWVEDRSRDTWENATFSAAMLKAEGITSGYLVTTSWHMPRSILAFERAGLAVTAAPVRAPDYVAGFDIIPQASGWQASYYAMHELIGYLWYRLRP